MGVNFGQSNQVTQLPNTTLQWVFSPVDNTHFWGFSWVPDSDPANLTILSTGYQESGGSGTAIFTIQTGNNLVQFRASVIRAN
jgi:hypothetical protein